MDQSACDLGTAGFDSLLVLKMSPHTEVFMITIQVMREWIWGPMILLSIVSAAEAADTRPNRVTLASTPESIPSVRQDGQIIDPERPGFRIALLREAGSRCGSEVEFSPMPWPRALEATRTGAVSGAFAASYSAERAAYAAFPLLEGQPDSARAMREQIYFLYTAADTTVSLKDGKLDSPTARLVVERGSIGVALARSLGAEPIEVANYATMLRMVAERRETAMLGVDHHVRSAARREPQLSNQIRQVAPFVGRFHNYVMFGRKFKDDHNMFVECFWTEIAKIRATPQYREMVRSYNDGDFIE